jgi:hypothetical protein
MCMTLVCEFCCHAPMMTFYRCQPVLGPHEHADLTGSTLPSFPSLLLEDDDALDPISGVMDGWAICQECSALMEHAQS